MITFLLFLALDSSLIEDIELNTKYDNRLAIKVKNMIVEILKISSERVMRLTK